MSEPNRLSAHEHNTAHVEDGLALLTSQFRDVAGIEAILASWLAQAQEVEDAFWSLYALSIGNSEGDALDQIGELLGRPRAGLSDGDYRLVLRATGVAIRSSGTVPELLEVLDAMRGGVTVTLTEHRVATVKVQPAAPLPIAAALVLEVLVRAKTAGVRLLVVDVPPGNLFRFAPADVIVVDPSHGFSDVAGTTGGHLVGILEG